ncbi:hypothetical protein EDC65_2143 [Stella humosa]|uniref:Uncharacterized protein n=1 Tax=Stella humosa TaxID=94 RepID=A0A3N1MCB0_9PROT|nr:hypothetical protein EDC65_2143 [Stella humosa]
MTGAPAGGFNPDFTKVKVMLHMLKMHVNRQEHASWN